MKKCDDRKPSSNDLPVFQRAGGGCEPVQRSCELHFQELSLFLAVRDKERANRYLILSGRMIVFFN